MTGTQFEAYLAGIRTEWLHCSLIQGTEGTYILLLLSQGLLTTMFQMRKLLMFYTTLTECNVRKVIP